MLISRVLAESRSDQEVGGFKNQLRALCEGKLEANSVCARAGSRLRRSSCVLAATSALILDFRLLRYP